MLSSCSSVAAEVDLSGKYLGLRRVVNGGNQVVRISQLAESELPQTLGQKTLQRPKGSGKQVYRQLGEVERSKKAPKTAARSSLLDLLRPAATC